LGVLSQGYNDDGFSGATMDRSAPPAARRHHAGLRIRDKIRGIVAALITGGAVLE
jgi:hypothetical protein